MSERHPLFLIVALALVAACGEVEHSPRWTCFNPSDQPFCQCEPSDPWSPDAGSVHACDGLQCCFASSDSCNCYGLTPLISDCSLIHATGATPVQKCPPD